MCGWCWVISSNVSKKRVNCLWVISYGINRLLVGGPQKKHKVVPYFFNSDLPLISWRGTVETISVEKKNHQIAWTSLSKSLGLLRPQQFPLHSWKFQDFLILSNSHFGSPDSGIGTYVNWNAIGNLCKYFYKRFFYCFSEVGLDCISAMINSIVLCKSDC